MKKLISLSLICTSIFINSLFQNTVFAADENCYQMIEWNESDYPDSSEGTDQAVKAIAVSGREDNTYIRYCTITDTFQERILKVVIQSFRNEDLAQERWEEVKNKPTWGRLEWQTTTTSDYTSAALFDPDPDDGLLSIQLFVLYENNVVVSIDAPYPTHCHNSTTDCEPESSFANIYADYWSVALEAMAIVDDKCGIAEENHTLAIKATPATIAPDGSSQSDILVRITDDNGNPVSSETVTLNSPEIGTLSTLSGVTDVQGEFNFSYLSPHRDALQGIEFVDIKATSGDGVTDFVRINFALYSATIWAEPNMVPYPETTAIIPGDDRFPAQYTITIRDASGNPFANQTLTASISDGNVGRLDHGQFSGREVTLTTDSDGKAKVSYTYVGGSRENTAPLEDIITFESIDLGIKEFAKASIGLNISINQIEGISRHNTSPKSEGLLIHLKEEYYPEMDFLAYIHELEKVTEKKLGIGITTEWLNRPNPDWLDMMDTFLTGTSAPSEPVLFDGWGEMESAGDAVIVLSQTTPYLTSGEHFLPALEFTSSGSYWFKIGINPVVCPDNGGDIAADGSDLVKGASNSTESSSFFGVQILDDAESVFQSLVCSFKPTTKQQFWLKTLYLDNPLLTTAKYIGATAAAPITIALGVVEVSDLLCDFMQGGYGSIITTLASKYISSINDHKPPLPLTDREKKMLYINSLVEYAAKGYGLVDNTVNLPSEYRAKTQLSVPRVLLTAQDGQLPPDMTFEELQYGISQMVSGILGAPQMAGWSILAVLGSGEIDVTGIEEDLYSYKDDSLAIYFFPAGKGDLSILTNEDVDIFYHIEGSDSKISVGHYSVINISSISHLTMDLSTDFSLLNNDSGADGIIDETLSPVIQALENETSGCKININEIVASGNREVGSQVTFTMDVDNSCSGTVYYRYSVHPDYGTDGYDGLHWSSMTSTEYTTEDSIAYTFNKAGKYIVVVWAKNAASDSNTGVEIIGLSIDIKEKNEMATGTIWKFGSFDGSNSELANGDNLPSIVNLSVDSNGIGNGLPDQHSPPDDDFNPDNANIININFFANPGNYTLRVGQLLTYQPETVTVSLDGSKVGTYTTISSNKTHELDLIIGSSGSHTLTFQEFYGNNGYRFDAVELVADETCQIDINGITISGKREVNSPIAFTIDAGNSCNNSVNYRFSAHPYYGTSGYDGLQWQSMTSTEYTTQNSIGYSFNKAGKYIVVAWGKNNTSDSNTGVEIIGVSVEIDEQGQEPYFPF